jgi:hypothetical protein
MRVIALSGAQSLLHPVFGAVEAGVDGVFDVSAAFGEELIKQRGQFITEGEHLANQVKASLVELSDPHKIPQVLHGLRERIASLEAELAAAKALPSEAVVAVKKLTAKQAKAASTEPPAGTTLTEAELAAVAAHDAGPATETNPVSDAVDQAAAPE